MHVAVAIALLAVALLLNAAAPNAASAAPRNAHKSGFAMIDSGASHSVALAADGTVWAWGLNTNGQLGNGSTAASSNPVQVTRLSDSTALTNIIAVGTGENHSMAVRADGTVWTWGLNTNGQLGDGSTTQRTRAVQATYLSSSTALTDFVSIDGGSSHTLAVRGDGTVWSWGLNANGQLGDGSATERLRAVQATYLSSSLGIANATDVVAGWSWSAALLADGSIWGWGTGSDGQLADGNNLQRLRAVQATMMSDSSAATNMVALAAEGNHLTALRADGTVWSAGWNGFGQLGDGSTTARNRLVQVTNFSDSSPLTNVVAIGGGGNHGLATRADGTVWAWGYNNAGQLGNGSTTNRSRAVQSTYASDSTGLDRIVDVTGGNEHSFAVRADGTLWAWGNNGSGRLGDGTTTSPRTRAVQSQLTAGCSFIQIEAGSGGVSGSHTLALRADGTVWAWGNDHVGQLGDDPLLVRRPTPVRVAGLTDVRAVAAGTYHSLALKADGTVWAWGNDTYGQLGDGGSNSHKSAPVQVANLANVATISSGWWHSLAVRADGTAWSWGLDDLGQLGNDAAIANSATPVQVAAVTSVRDVSGGFRHSLLLRANGTGWSSGNDTSGQLGDDAVEATKSTPVAIATLTNITGLAAGGNHSLARLGGGDGYAWGRDVDGQLGNDAAIAEVRTPVAVATVSRLRDIDGGADGSVAVGAAGQVWTWGSDAQGQLGNDAALTSQPTPVSVAGATLVQRVTQGAAHTIAMTATGGFRSWGEDAAGELGNDPTYADQATPVNVATCATSVTITTGPAGNVAPRQSTIWWETGAIATTELHYDTVSHATGTPAAYAFSSTYPYVVGTAHSRTLPDLAPGTYYYRVQSTDPWGNVAYSSEATLVVTETNDTPIDRLVFDGAVTSVAEDATHTYLVGQFTRVFANRTGAAVVADTTTGSSAVDAWVVGRVFDAVTDGDGGWYIGGEFTRVGGLVRNNAAHILADGGIDPYWNPNVNDIVRTVAVDDSGRVYLGGDFSGTNSVGTSTRNYVARVSGATGAVDTGWNATVSNYVEAIELADDGTVYLGGALAGGAVRANATNGTIDGSWNPQFTIGVMDIELDGAGWAYVAGSFNGANSVNGTTTRNRVAKVDTTGSGTVHPTWDPNVNNAVHDIELANDAVYLAGRFSGANSINGTTTRNRLAKVDTVNGTVDPSWNPNMTAIASIANDLEIDGNNVYVAGSFEGNVGGVTRWNTARMDASSGTVDATWNPNVSGAANVVAVAGSSAFVGGDFAAAGPSTTRNRAAKVDRATGALDGSWNPNISGSVYDIELDGAGSAYLVGGFSGSNSVNGTTTRNRAAKVDTANGIVDPSWHPNVPTNDVYDIELDGTGSAYLAGSFLQLGADTRNHAGKVNTSSGAVDPDWDPDLNNTVFEIELDGTGNAYLAGSFSGANSVNGTTTRNRLAKVDTTFGTVDASWDPNASNNVYDLELDGTGGAFVVGVFTGANSINGTATRNRAARVTGASGTVDATWNPNASNQVLAVTSTASAVYVTGAFRTLNGTTRPQLAEISRTTGSPSSWDAEKRNAPNSTLVNVRAFADIGEHSGLLYANSSEYNDLGSGAVPHQGLATFDLGTPAGITVSGNAYENEAGLDWNDCNGITQNVTVKVVGGASYSTTCDGTTGAFSVSGVIIPAADAVLAVYLDDNALGLDDGVTYTRAADTTSAISGLAVTENSVRIRSESTTNFTNAAINSWDATNDATDLSLVSSDGTALTVAGTAEIHVDSGETFAPGGNVTAGGLHLAGTYAGTTELLTLTAAGTGACSAGAGTMRPLCIDGGTYTAGTNTTRFTATGDAHIDGATYNVVQLRPSGAGSPTFQVGAGSSTLVAGTFTVGDSTNAVTVSTTAFSPTLTIGYLSVGGFGTFSGSGTGTITVTGPVDGTGDVDLTAGSFVQRVSTNRPFGFNGGPNDWRFNDLTFSNSAATPSTITIASGAGGATTHNVTGTLTVGNPADTATTVLDVEATDRILDIDGSLVVTARGTLLASSGAALQLAGNFTRAAGGTFTPGTGTVTLDGATPTTLSYAAATTFANLTVATASKQVLFDNVDQTNVTGALTVSGAACGTRVALGSDLAGTPFELNASGTASVQYATITDSTAVTARTATNSVSGGGNTGWTISMDSCTPPPSIVDNQLGDDTWRSTNSGSYDIDYTDLFGLTSFEVRAYSAAAEGGSQLQDWTQVSTLVGTSHTTNWSLPTSTWDALGQGTNYISVRVHAGARNASLVDAFHVKKDTVAPSAVTTSLTSSRPPELSWLAASDASSGVAYYRVYRSTAAGELGTQLNADGATTGTSFTDNSSLSPTIYYYTVRAVDNVGIEQLVGNNQVAVSVVGDLYLTSNTSTQLTSPVAGRRLNTTLAGGGATDATQVTIPKGNGAGSCDCIGQFLHLQAGATNAAWQAALPTTPGGRGYLHHETGGRVYQAGTWRFDMTAYTSAPQSSGTINVRAWRVKLVGGAINSPVAITNWIESVDIPQTSATTVSVTANVASPVTFAADEFLYVEYWWKITGQVNNSASTALFRDNSGSEFVVTAPPNWPLNTVAPSIPGTPRVGTSVTANVGTWSPAASSYAYQWQQCDVTGATCSDIGGATGASYTPTAGDEAKTLRVRVTATNADGSTSARSAPSAVVAAAPTLPTMTYLTGFEHGTVSTAGGGLVSGMTGIAATTSATGYARNGQFGLRLRAGSGNSASVKQNWSGSVAVARYAIRIHSSAAADQTVAGLGVVDGNIVRLTWDAPNSRLRVSQNFASYANSPVLPVGQWHVIDMRVDTSANPHVVTWRVNGVDMAPSNYAAASSTITDVGFGTDWSGHDYDVAIDDVALSATSSDYPIGDGKVVALRPDGRVANGTDTNFSDGLAAAFGATSHLQVDDSPLASDAKYLRQNTNTTGTAFAELSLRNAGGTTAPRGVRGLVAHRTEAAGAASAGARFRSGATETTLHGGAMPTSLEYDAAMLAAPGGDGWSVAEADALTARVGYATAITDKPVWDAVMAEAEFPVDGVTESNLAMRVEGYDASGAGPTTAPASINLGSALPGSTLTAEAAVTVTTDATGGYTLSASDADGNGALHNTAAASSIAWNAATALVSAVTLSDWSGTGLAISAYGGASTPAKYCDSTCASKSAAGLNWGRLSPDGASYQLTSHTAPTPAGDTTKFPMKVTIPTTQSAGNYAGEVHFSATGSP